MERAPQQEAKVDLAEVAAARDTDPADMDGDVLGDGLDRAWVGEEVGRRQRLPVEQTPDLSPAGLLRGA